MREHLIAFIKAFQAKQDGSPNGRNQTTIGYKDEITLTFGYGYYRRNEVWVSNEREKTCLYLSPEEAVDEYLKFYKLED